ncbi:MAG: minichromosome maintenance protein MCM [Candidatus Bathyarchaeota archaeon]|jgi:replicative DNA helicase Mcm|nr:minichromosome maintenance protein MCM [Candidatus Bathyarchaeota archaeon]
MANLIQSEESFTRFIEGFRDERGEVKYEQTLSEMAVKGLKSFTVDFKDLYSFDPDLARTTLDAPGDQLQQFSIAAFQKLRIRDPAHADSIRGINVRFRALPTETALRRIGAEHIGHLVMVTGIIVRATSIQPFILKADFTCGQCGEILGIDQTDQFLKTPRECTTCGSRRGFELNAKTSVFIDSQRLAIQERPEELPAGQLPRQVNVDVKDDIVDVARPGDRVSITGVLNLIRKQTRGGALRVFDFTLEANNVDVSGREMELLELTEEDEEEIREIAQDPWVHRRLLQSIAPSIFGLDEIKESILYLLFNGVSKNLPDVRIRGDINVLLVGDPGTGKSQLLMYASKVAPRGLMTTGRGSTAAGLTAAVVKEGGTGSFTLEAGALVLGDKGIVCIDEMDKMRDEDRGAIHPAMEQQVVSIAKGGIVATLNARTSILAAANPTLGRYNPYQTIAQNISLPVTLLSRFDLIFILRDIPAKDRDSKMAEHILRLHLAAGSPDTAHLNTELLRKYISYARRTDPVITEDVVQAFQDYYVKMRTASLQGGEASAVSITARQLESLVRLAEARARVHLREEVTVEDAEAAISLMQRSLEQVGIDVETGEQDIDLLYTGKPRSLQNKLQSVLGVIGEMDRIEGMVRDDDLYEALSSDHGIGRTEAAKLIGTLMRDGTIYSPRPGYYKRTV